MSGIRVSLSLMACAWICGAQSGVFQLSSPAVSKSGEYPVEFTCDGESASPPLTWSNAPAGTRSFALTMHHIPGPGAENHVYLVIYNLPATMTSLGKNAHGVGTWGINTVNRRPEYTPPCSKGPGAKKYTLTVYALSSEPTLHVTGNVADVHMTMDALLEAIQGKTLATSTLDVTYARANGGGGGGVPRLPQELERALSSLELSGPQKEKVQGLVQQYGEKQRQLREELLKQLKSTLSAEQFAKVEEVMRQPPPRR